MEAVQFRPFRHCEYGPPSANEEGTDPGKVIESVAVNPYHATDL